MNAFEQATAREYAGKMLCLVAGHPDALSDIKSSLYGRSHFTVHGTTYHMDTTKNGIQLRTHYDDTRTVIRWADINAHIRSLPQHIRDEARDVDQDAHKPPASCLEWLDSRYQQRRTDAEFLAYHLWHHSVIDRRADVLARAFPDAEQDEPLDLFTSAGVDQ